MHMHAMEFAYGQHINSHFTQYTHTHTPSTNALMSAPQSKYSQTDADHSFSLPQKNQFRPAFTSWRHLSRHRNCKKCTVIVRCRPALGPPSLHLITPWPCPLTFPLYSQCMPRARHTIWLPALIAQAVFLLKHGHIYTETQSHRHDWPLYPWLS